MAYANCNEYHCRIDIIEYLYCEFIKNQMTTTGYIFCSEKCATIEQDKKWMKDFGCRTIIEEYAVQEKLRPQWRQLLGNCSQRDTIVISKFSNALRGVRELGAFLDLCNQYGLRVVSIHDEIDSAGQIFTGTTPADVLRTLGDMASEANALRRRVVRSQKKQRSVPKTIKATLRKDRELSIVKMYSSGVSIDDIWKTSGYKSRTSVFRVLARNGVKLNRGPHQGPIKKRNQ